MATLTATVGIMPVDQLRNAFDFEGMNAASRARAIRTPEGCDLMQALADELGLTKEMFVGLEAYKGTSVRPTWSSIRDYTSPLALLMLTTGLTNANVMADYGLKYGEKRSIDLLRFDRIEYPKRFDGFGTKWRGVPLEQFALTMAALNMVLTSEASLKIGREIALQVAQAIMNDHEQAYQTFGDRLREHLLDIKTPEAFVERLEEILRVRSDLCDMSLKTLSSPAPKETETMETKSDVKREVSYGLSAGSFVMSQDGESAERVLQAMRDGEMVSNEALATLKTIFERYEDGAAVADDLDELPEEARTIVMGIRYRLALPESVSEEPSAPAYVIDSTVRKMVDKLLEDTGVSIGGLIDESTKIKKSLADLQRERDELKAKLATSGALTSKGAVETLTGEVPKGEWTWEPAIKLIRAAGIKVPKDKEKQFMFDVPSFTWEFAHPGVPELDTGYQWRFDLLAKVMWGLAHNKKPWVWGHTGTGKTTLIEQVCAIQGWPFVRINFDSEITRMDLIGRDTLTADEHGHQVSKFMEGILPQALQQPCVICNDELDFVRSDIAYVYQRALEDKGLLLTEDAGRLVTPHELNRMAATANTQGQGDEFGLYQGARVQSQAFLDRFQCWLEVPYLDSEADRRLLKDRVPSLTDDMIEKVVRYAKEHREAFKQATILKPMSPRGLVSMGEAIAFFTMLDTESGLRTALEATVLGSVTHADAAKINELVDRVFN